MELNERKEILQLQLHQMGRGQEQYVCVSARARTLMCPNTAPS